jgi:hypothetical protein
MGRCVTDDETDILAILHVGNVDELMCRQYF